MTEQRRDQSQHGQQAGQKREAPGSGQRDQQHGESAADRAQRGEKPMTEKASHQGGGHVRSDHLPQGK
ncbi:MAG TPA: hypothetical protein VHY80_06560 [Stellaceae bacterium]|nr:hypothetical protein [Stellaceae bacterium]